jgi:hypothetical protein
MAILQRPPSRETIGSIALSGRTARSVLLLSLHEMRSRYTRAVKSFGKGVEELSIAVGVARTFNEAGKLHLTLPSGTTNPQNWRNDNRSDSASSSP